MKRAQLLSVRQIAAHLQMEESTVYTRAQQGKIPAVKTGRTWRFSRSDPEAWLAAEMWPVAGAENEVSDVRWPAPVLAHKPPEETSGRMDEEEKGAPAAMTRDRQGTSRAVRPGRSGKGAPTSVSREASGLCRTAARPRLAVAAYCSAIVN